VKQNRISSGTSDASTGSLFVIRTFFHAQYQILRQKKIPRKARITIPLNLHGCKIFPGSKDQDKFSWPQEAADRWQCLSDYACEIASQRTRQSASNKRKNLMEKAIWSQLMPQNGMGHNRDVTPTPRSSHSACYRQDLPIISTKRECFTSARDHHFGSQAR
jgi:hypothetical protein